MSRAVVAQQHDAIDPSSKSKLNIEPPSFLAPAKRRKLDICPDATEDQLLEPALVKREQSPTPPPSLDPRTSGTIRVDIPLSCQKTQPDWREKRNRWIADEVERLKRLGLQIPKRLVRDDGLALDWVSPVPVCPLMLKPPSVDVKLKGERSHPFTSETSARSTIDPLGHALRGQTASAHSAVTIEPRVNFEANSRLTCANDAVSPSELKDDSGPPSHFVIVGAALLKKNPRSPDTQPNSTPIDDMVQMEHRKLLPPDLRRSATRFYRGGQGRLRDLKARRKAWIETEIEKVEGYTGERVAGFQYDGDDVIIKLKSRQPARPSRVQPHPIKHGQPCTSDAHAPSPNRISALTSADTYVNPSENCNGDDCQFQFPDSRNVGSGVRRDRMVEDPADVRPLDGNTMDVARRADERPVFGADASDRMTTVAEPAAIDGVLGTTEARGLDFLVRYLQLFDTNRDALTLAYTPNATFSLQTEEGYPNPENAQHESPKRTNGRLPQIVKTGPAAIVETLKQMGPCLHHSPLSNIVYSITTLDDISPGGLLLTCHGPMVYPNDTTRTSEWSFSRIFVLKQNHQDGRWPLLVGAERMSIRRKRTRDVEPRG